MQVDLVAAGEPLSPDTARGLRRHIANLASPVDAVAQDAEVRLCRFGSKAVYALIDATNSDDRQVWFRAVWALGKIGDERALPAILRLTDDHDGAVRYDAACALGDLGTLKAVSALEAITQRADDPSNIASAALAALVKLGVRSADDEEEEPPAGAGGS